MRAPFSLIQLAVCKGQVLLNFSLEFSGNCVMYHVLSSLLANWSSSPIHHRAKQPSATHFWLYRKPSTHGPSNWEGGSSIEVEPPATNLTMRAIQAAEELAKALKLS